ncbi:MAG: AAA family ATPase [Desulfatiglandaceae bacterium]|jgi:predicted ATPase
MHLKKVTLLPEKYPNKEYYPFNLPTFHETKTILFQAPVSIFVGENGTGKSTLLEAICRKCDIHIWRSLENTRFENNPYEEALYRFITVEWMDGVVPGSFFTSERSQEFARYLDEWAKKDPGMLNYFGGKSLMTQSHGQSLMSFFRARYQKKGLYLLDEPETALSPRSQLELVNLIRDMGKAGHAQFIIATHSPILMACPDAKLYNFDDIPVKEIDYEQTDHYKIYKRFMEDRTRFL